MINIIFDKVYNNKSIVFAVDKNQITWELLFDFLEKKTNISKYKTKFFINNKFYTCKEKIPFNHKDFIKDSMDFLIINVRFYDNIDVQINALKASISSLIKNDLGVTDLILKLKELEDLRMNSVI